jgi:hypothetical protein
MGLNKLNHIYTTEPLTVESLLATNDIGILDNILLDGQLGDANQVIAINAQGNGIEWATLDALPSQTGNSGKYLTTNGTASSWGAVDALPSQTGNSGKYLTTNGTAAAWASIVTDPTPSVFMLMGA